MPVVSGKHYPYSAAGRKAAKAEAKRTGKPVRDAKKAREPQRKRSK